MATIPVASRTLFGRLKSAREQTDKLFDLLRPEALYARPVPERHRLIFYLGHLEAFDWNLIGRKTLGAGSFHPQFEQLFEFGIDPPVGKAAEDQPSDWPAATEVLAYNRRVRDAIDELFEQVPEQIAHVALEHRLMHAETFAYLLHNLTYTEKVPQDGPAFHAARSVAGEMIAIPRGTTTLGQSPGQFGWDNEFAQYSVNVPAFAIGKYKVTNGQYVEFVRDGASPPHFWTQRGGQWFYRGMFSEMPLPLNAPVYVTHAEACAYAQWSGKQLPTEAQFHRAAYGTPEGDERPYPWGSAPPGAARGNFDFHHWDPVDVDATPSGDSAFGVAQLVGNGWEWTATQFGPFAGFQPFPFYPGYSQNFFGEEHFVMKGGSARTAACLLRRSFRNWFRPNYPYVYACFRIVEN
jgi:gamma-glutamyl hercynylcysteine S-oxide synthase